MYAKFNKSVSVPHVKEDCRKPKHTQIHRKYMNAKWTPVLYLINEQTMSAENMLHVPGTLNEKLSFLMTFWNIYSFQSCLMRHLTECTALQMILKGLLCLQSLTSPAARLRWEMLNILWDFSLLIVAESPLIYVLLSGLNIIPPSQSLHWKTEKHNTQFPKSLFAHVEKLHQLFTSQTIKDSKKNWACVSNVRRIDQEVFRAGGLRLCLVVMDHHLQPLGFALSNGAKFQAMH